MSEETGRPCVLYTKAWSQNAFGEQTVGPWVERGRFRTYEEARAEADQWDERQDSYGTFTRIDLLTNAKPIRHVYPYLRGE